jgi:hypothetical protein
MIEVAVIVIGIATIITNLTLILHIGRETRKYR